MRKTSSRVGRRRARSSTPTPAWLRRLTAATIAPARSRTRTLISVPSTAGASSDSSASARAPASHVGVGHEADLEALAADAVLELVGGARGR